MVTAKVTQKAVDIALEGDTTTIRLCLERIAPPHRDTPVKFALPKIETVADVAVGAASILETVSASELTPSEGAQVIALIETAAESWKRRN